MSPSDIAKKIIFDLVVKKAIQRVILAVPFFGLPVVNPVFVYVAQKLFVALYDELEFQGELLLIGLKTEHEKKKYDEAVNEFKTSIEQGKSDEEINRAHEEFKNRLRDLVRLKP